MVPSPEISPDEYFSTHPEGEHRLFDLTEQLTKMKQDCIMCHNMKGEHDQEKVKEFRYRFQIIFKGKSDNVFWKMLGYGPV